MGWWQQRELVKRTTLAFMKNEYADDWRHAVQGSTGFVQCLHQMVSSGYGTVVWEMKDVHGHSKGPFT